MQNMDRFVIDTNVLVSGIVLPSSLPRQAVEKAFDDGVLILSETTMSELAQVPSRPKFDDYVSMEERTLFLAELGRATKFVSIVQLVRECRDPKDDKFLEVALNGRADLIITGGADLLVLNPWRDVAVLSPLQYLKR
jgi:putative PIN family toxin of toxin-antitoxin system